jgi:V/A-type H+/Na+-transporting ATPase subunit K
MVVVESIGLVAIGAGIAVGLAAGVSAYGQAMVASAGVGAIAEDKSLFGRSLALAALIETQAIYGFIIALLLILYGFGVIVV